MAKAGKSKRYPLLEWVSAAIGLVIIVSMLGFLALEAIEQGEDGPPVLHVSQTGLSASNGNYIVELEVRNISGRTGAGVGVEGALMRGSEEVETSTTSLSYVPGQSRRRAGLVFTRDPRKFRLDLRVTGFERP